MHGEAFNFGPSSEKNFTVQQVVEEMTKLWKGANWDFESENKIKFHESGLLKLNCDKALHYLNWKSTLDFNETIKFTIDWYNYYYSNQGSVRKMTEKQINDFSEIFRKNMSKLSLNDIKIIDLAKIHNKNGDVMHFLKCLIKNLINLEKYIFLG